ncbi:IreB family regulatory phosphoprotein [Beduinella massiliensis]|uniref:IreB family regulatory phosphoprotein n=1 Tax=Beduinella massiliensis TaxID=1852363 RepID=UPI000C83310E
MADRSENETRYFRAVGEAADDAHSILMRVYDALRAKGYDPITQIVGYLMSGDPTYITSYQSARSLVCRIERDELMEELVRSYIEHNAK